MAAKPKTTYAVNKSGNAYHGQTYAIQKAPGGVFHVYNDGRKVFMPATKPAVPAKPAQPRPQAAPKPVTSSAASAAAAQPVDTNNPYAGQVAPDSQYWDETSGNVFDINQQKTGLDESDRSLRANYDEALRRMAGYEADSRNNSLNDLNSSGLAMSSTANKRLDSIATEYARQRADALQGLTGNLAENTTKRRALDAGFLVDDGRNLEGSAGRQIARDETKAANNMLAVNPSVPMKRRRVQQGQLVAVKPKRRRRRI